MKQMTGFTIRPAEPRDAPAMASILRHYIQSSAVTLDITPPVSSSFDEKIKTIQDFGGPFGVLTDDQECVVGYGYGATYRPKKGYNCSIELTIYLAPGVTGQGLGRRMLNWLIDQCRASGFKLAISVITVDPKVGAHNMPSGKLHLRLGFSYVGTIHNVASKFDQYWDTATFTLDLAPTRAKP